MADLLTVFVATTPDAGAMAELMQRELAQLGLRALPMRVPQPGWDSETLESGHGVVLVLGRDRRADADEEGLLRWAHARGRPAAAILMETAEQTLAPPQHRPLDAQLITHCYPGDDLAEKAAGTARFMYARLSESAPAAAWIDLTLHPPATQPEPDDAGVVVSEVEGLLLMAERFVADEVNPDDVRDEVDARRRQLRDELRLIEQGKGRSVVLAGISGALLDLVRPAPADEGLGAALDEVADGLGALGRASSDDERVEAGEEVVTALDRVGEEMAEIVEADDGDDLKAAVLRTAGAWVEEDFRAHLNGFITLYRERLAGPSGVTGGAAVGLMGGPPWLAVTIVAAGLLRSLFPWIFPPRTAPEEPPAEG